MKSFGNRSTISAHHGGAAWENSRLQPDPRVIDADVLDAWFDPAPGVVLALSQNTGWMARTSPPANCSLMLDSIAKAKNLDPATLVPGAGSSDLIYRILLRKASPADRVLIVDPSYSEYRHIFENVIGCSVHIHPLQEESAFRIDLNLLAKEAQGCRWVILVNPNNPVGKCFSRLELLEFQHELPPETWLWVDEAYLDYVDRPESLEHDVEGRNMIVLQSLSKTLALSGLRAAYAVVPRESARDIQSITPPWLVSLPAQIAVRQALRDPEYYQARYCETRDLRALLANKIGELNAFHVFEGAANWILLLEAGGVLGAEELCRRCAEQGLLLRNASLTSTTLIDSAIRVAVKDSAINEQIVERLQRVLST